MGCGSVGAKGGGVGCEGIWVKGRQACPNFFPMEECPTNSQQK